MFEFHVSRAARDRYKFSDTLFSNSGTAVFADLAAVREFARLMNEVRNSDLHPELAVNAGAINGMGLIDEALHLLLAAYREQRDPTAMADALTFLEKRLGGTTINKLLTEFAEQFPTVAVYRGKQPANEWLSGSTANVSNRVIALEEALFLWLANANPAFRKYGELFDDSRLASKTDYPKLAPLLREFFNGRPRFGPEDQNVIDLLRAPALASPDSLSGQLAFMRERWATMLGDFIHILATAAGILQEEEVAIWRQFNPPAADRHFGGGDAGDSSVAAVPQYDASSSEQEYERFSADVEWMPRTVMIAKSIYVWLDQLSRQYRREIRRLDQVPDEELDLFARHGFNAVWIIGIWERSRASQRIKQISGNPEAGASAYSLHDYVIADDLGGDGAYANLRDRAQARGIRLASDMVPNHMGIDSRWVIEHPDWFISLPTPPFPAYRFEGPDVSSDSRVELKIEDHYFNRSDAAVVFMRRDQATSDTRFVYHGNDGTSFPWNDTAQLNYLKPEVREGVIQTILHVARQFPIIRFDAAMTLTKRHYQRLWFPQPGTGSAIASRAEHGLTKEQFDRAMPHEFWREVVDRVAVEAPGTLLLAEAFWLLESYFVRTLGMHRVYNSAFMNMLRDEENANYRKVIKNTLEFDPEVLKRYVNFISNPDERTSVDQFGKGDKYFGVCTLLATMPGLPMFGHGQIEGYAERYGMEYRRSYIDERPDTWLVARHEREICPLLHRRSLFADVRDFLLYDFYADDGGVNEDVYAYSNQSNGERALVVFNNRYANTRGWIRVSASYAEKNAYGDKHLRQRTLGDALWLSNDSAQYIVFRDAATGLEYLHHSPALANKGMHLELSAYRCHVFLDWRDVRDDGARPWGELCNKLQGRGVTSLEDELRTLELEPVHAAMFELLEPSKIRELVKAASKPSQKQLNTAVSDVSGRLRTLLEAVNSYPWNSTGGQPQGGEPGFLKGDKEKAVTAFEARLNAALRLPEIEKQFSSPWPPDVSAVLPSQTVTAKKQEPAWAMLVAWAAVETIGTLHTPGAPQRATEMMFERLKLREAIAKGLVPHGLVEDARWRGGALVRVAFAHAAWAPTSDISPATVGLTWLRDAEVAWLIGVHEHEGVRYLVREPFEQLLWWMSLRSMLDLAADKTPDATKIKALERSLATRLGAAAKAGYRVEVLLDDEPEPDSPANAPK